MKTTISIPESLNDSIDVFLKMAKISRSEFFQRAARSYLQRTSADAVVANLDRIHGEQAEPLGEVPFRQAALVHLRELLGREGG